MAMPDLQRYTWNLHQINNVEDNVVFLCLTVLNSDNLYMFSCSLNAQVSFVEKPQLKTIGFQNFKL